MVFKRVCICSKAYSGSSESQACFRTIYCNMFQPFGKDDWSTGYLEREEINTKHDIEKAGR